MIFRGGGGAECGELVRSGGDTPTRVRSRLAILAEMGKQSEREKRGIKSHYSQKRELVSVGKSPLHAVGSLL